MAFERKSMEDLVQRMVFWGRGTSTKFTDFRVGSRIRTLYEAVGLIVEEFYDKTYRSTKALIETNIYAVMSFDKQPAVAATGTVTFSRVAPADTAYLIPSGTLLRTKATAVAAPVVFRTTADAVIPLGGTSAAVTVVCQSAGVIGNVDAGTITDFVTKPSGIDLVLNPNPISTGREEETADEQKYRFQQFISSLSRGTLQSVAYGATTGQVAEASGLVIERVVDSRAFEYLPERKGEVDVYIWNGVGNASEALIADTKKKLYGYYTAAGAAVYGYKPAGIIVNVFSAAASQVYVRIHVQPEEGATLADLVPYIEFEIGDYFSTLRQGDTLVQTGLETRVKLIDGVYDVKIALSQDGETYSYENITSGATAIFVPHAPYDYVLMGG